MDNFTVDEAENEDENDKYRDEIRLIADELERKAKRMEQADQWIKK